MQPDLRKLICEHIIRVLQHQKDVNQKQHICVKHDFVVSNQTITVNLHSVSEFDRERIVAYRYCGLPFKEIGGHVGPNQTTAKQIYDRGMQKGTTDRNGRTHPPQCTTSREGRLIVRMAVTDRSVTSRTVAHHIEPVKHHSVSSVPIRRHLQQSDLSARHPSLGLSLTQNLRCLSRQWCYDRRMWAAEWNEVVFNDESRISLQHYDGRV
ncbi:transposable element Tcb1 transposase [Trichonephila clavipes]|nr:transposable element Tcb1 transposase [Trichonephila clavipes]